MALRKSAVNISGDKIPLRRASPAALRSQLWTLPWGRGGRCRPSRRGGTFLLLDSCVTVPTVAKEDFMWHR